MANKDQQNFFTLLLAGLATLFLGPIAGFTAFQSFAIRAAVGLIANLLQPDPPKRVQGYRVTQRGTAIDHQVVYGKARVAGTIVFDTTTGTNNKYLHRVIAFTGHEIESFDKLYINGLEVETLAGDGNVASIIDENGSSSGRYNNYIRIKKHLGADSQTADADLVSEVAEWTTNHRLRGISYLYVRMKFKQEVYPNGIPEITADIKGKKVYNPATTLTAWSDNPALCVRDYLTSSYGLNDISANIDDTLVTTAANACNRTASNADTWFTMNGAFNTSAVPADILGTLLSTMGGTLWFSQGKWRMRAAIWEAPTLTLDEDDLRSPLSVNTRHSRRDNFNVIKGTFSGPETQWFPSDYPEYKVAQAITDDGGIESVVDLNLPFTDNSAECQRVARIVYERNRQQLTVKGNFGLRAFDLQVGDVVRLDNARLGFDDLNIKYFEVVDWNFAASVGEIIVSLTLRETSSSVFDEIDSYATFELDNTSLSSPFDVQTVTYGTPQTSAPINRDGTALPEILFTWSVDNTDEVDYYIFSYKKSGDSVYTSINVSDTYYRLSAAISGVTYNYAIQAVNHKGVRSPFTASSVSTVNDTVAPSAPTGLTATGGYQNVVLDWINPTDYDFAYVEVYRVEGSDVLVGTVSGTSFVDGGRDNETLYTYKLKAVDFSGNKSSFTATQSATTIAEVSGPPGAAGSRGAGWWRYVDTTNASTYYDTDTQNRVNAAWSAAVGLAIVEGDRFIISCTDIAIAFIYSSGLWVLQDNFIDGGLLVSGTLGAEAINATFISAIDFSAETINADQINVNNLISFADNGGLATGSKTTFDDEADGILIGNDASGNFFAEMSINKGTASQESLLFSDGGLKLINPEILYGSVSSTSNIYTTTQTVNISDSVDYVTVSGTGGGGGGGGGTWNGSGGVTVSGKRGGQGGTTTFRLEGNDAAGSPVTPVTYNATGGFGGWNGRSVEYFTDYRTGQTGESTRYGTGGTGGSPTTGSNPGQAPFVNAYGAGGGGGGGSHANLFNWYTSAAGLRGEAGNILDLNSAFSALGMVTSRKVVITNIGAGGVGSSGSKSIGGAGAAGAIEIIEHTNTLVELDDVINSTTRDVRHIESIGSSNASWTPKFSGPAAIIAIGCGGSGATCRTDSDFSDDAIVTTGGSSAGFAVKKVRFSSGDTLNITVGGANTVFGGLQGDTSVTGTLAITGAINVVGGGGYNGNYDYGTSYSTAAGVPGGVATGGDYNINGMASGSGTTGTSNRIATAGGSVRFRSNHPAATNSYNTSSNADGQIIAIEDEFHIHFSKNWNGSAGSTSSTTAVDLAVGAGAGTGGRSFRTTSAGTTTGRNVPNSKGIVYVFYYGDIADDFI